MCSHYCGFGLVGHVFRSLVFFIEMVEFRLQCIQYFGFEVHRLCNSRGLGVVAEYMYRGPS